MAFVGKIRGKIEEEIENSETTFQVFKAMHKSLFHRLIFIFWLVLYLVSTITSFPVGNIIQLYSILLVIYSIKIYNDTSKRLKSDKKGGKSLSFFTILLFGLLFWFIILYFFDFLNPLFGLLGIMPFVTFISKKLDKLLEKIHLLLMIIIGVIMRFAISWIYYFGIDNYSYIVDQIGLSTYDSILVTIFLYTLGIGIITYLFTYIKKTEKKRIIRRHMPIIVLLAFIYNLILFFGYVQGLYLNSEGIQSDSFGIYKLIILVLSTIFLIKGMIDQVLIDTSNYTGTIEKIRNFLRQNAYANLLMVMSSIIIGIYVAESVRYTSVQINLIYATILSPFTFIVFLLFYQMELNRQNPEENGSSKNQAIESNQETDIPETNSNQSITPSSTKSKFCTTCGEKLSGDSNFCTSCGSTVTPQNKFCTKCGTPRQVDNKFCTKCGNSF